MGLKKKKKAEISNEKKLVAIKKNSQEEAGFGKH